MAGDFDLRKLLRLPKQGREDALAQKLDRIEAKLDHLDLIEARLDHLDLIEARLDHLERYSHGGHATYIGSNRVLTKIRVAEHVFAFIVEADDRLISPWFIVTGGYETTVTDFFVRNVRHDSHCIDVGSNFGYFSCLMARLAFGGKLIALEADRHVFELVRDNLGINGLSGHGTALHMAAAAEPGSLTMYRRPTRSANTSIVDYGEAFSSLMGETPAEAFSVPAGTIDGLLDRLDGRVDFMKVDIEGSEPLAFRGAHQTIAANPQLKIIMEWSPGQIEVARIDIPGFLDELEALGLKAYEIEGGRPTSVSWTELLNIPYRAGILLTRSPA